MPPSDTIHKRTLAPKWAGSKTVWNPDTGEDTKCPAMELMCQTMCYNQFPTSDTIHEWTVDPEVGRFHMGETDMSNYVLTEVGRFHIGALTVVEPTSAYF